MSLNFKNLENFSIYLGLNDQDDFKQKFSTDEAKKMVSDIVGKYFDGSTIIEANGNWTDSFGNVVKENTIIIKISNGNENLIITLCEELKAVFNQNCVMVEKIITPICFI